MFEGDLLSAQEVARRLAIHNSTVRRMIDRGDFPNAFKAGRDWRIPEDDLEAYVENQKRERRAVTSISES